MLDALYDGVFMPLWSSESDLIHTERVHNSIFHVCEAVRKKCDETNVSMMAGLFEQVRSMMTQMISEESSEARAVRELEELKRAIEAAKVVQT